MKKKLSNRLYSYISKMFLLCGIMFLGYGQMHAQELSKFAVVSKPTLVEGKYDVELTYTGHFDCCNSHKMETFFANGKINLLFTGTLAVCPTLDTCIKTLTYELKDLQAGEYIFNYGKDTTIIIGEQPCIDSSKIEINAYGVCPKDNSPVCGCNGVTYRNSCLAEKAGVLSYTQGACSNLNNLPKISIKHFYVASKNAYEVYVVGDIIGNSCVNNTFEVTLSEDSVILKAKPLQTLVACNGSFPIKVSATISNLKPGTYHFIHDTLDTIVELKYPTNTCIDSSKINPNILCYEVYEPVCGCNGVTYSNECDASTKGVMSYTKGACPNKIGLPQFKISLFFNTEADTYNVSISGEILGNDCMEDILDVVLTNDSVILKAKLFPTFMACLDSLPKSVTASIQDLKPGTYHFIYDTFDTIIDLNYNTEEPFCIDSSIIDTDAVCTYLYNPVCGCNGVTYPNSCLADNAGVISYTIGACPNTKPKPAPKVTVVSKSTNVEGIYDVEFEYTGIFDCCNQQSMGVTLLDDTLHLGFISTLMACDIQDTCEKTFTYQLEGVKAGEYVLHYGYTSYLDSTIVIGEKPCIDTSLQNLVYICAQIYAPVCGCDDVTYDNQCVAMNARVTRFSEGVCEKIKIVSVAILNNNSIIQVTFDKPVTLYDGIENDFKILVELLEKTGEVYQIKKAYGLLGGNPNTIVLELVKPLPSKNVKIQFKTGDVFNIQTGLIEVDSNSLIVYPNPADSYIYIAERNVTKIEIVSINSQETAKTVHTIKYPIQISVHDLARGWYVVKVHTKDKVISSKFFKN